MTMMKLLRFYVSNTDKVKYTTVYEALAFAAKRYDMSGVTVYKGIMGYGANKKMVSDKFWELTGKTPIVVEIIDEAEKIDKFLSRLTPWLNHLPHGCLVVVHDVEMCFYKSGKKDY